MVVKLLHPISIKTAFDLKTLLIEQVTIRRPKLKDIMGIHFNGDPVNDQKNMRLFVSRVTSIPLENIDELDLVDWNFISEKISRMTTERRSSNA